MACVKTSKPVAATAAPDSVRVVVSADGHAALTTQWSADDPPADPWILELPPAKDLLTGKLVDAEDNAYARAYVLARSVDRPQDQRRADVDTDGADTLMIAVWEATMPTGRVILGRVTRFSR